MKEVVGCGIDIEEIARFKFKIPSTLNQSGFSGLVYTPSEIAANLDINPWLTFPLCFSCKEAFFKAFGVSWVNSKISWKDIELLFTSKKDLHKYSIRLNGYAKELFHKIKCSSFDSSLEYTDDYVMFQIVLLS
jgi:phosphopantetheine--protein transferase-like protein